MRGFLRLAGFGLALLLSVMVWNDVALAQGLSLPGLGGNSAQKEQQTADDRQLDNLIQTLENSSQRKELVDQLKALRKAKEAEQGRAESSVLLGLTSHFETLGRELIDAIVAVKDAPRLAQWFSTQVTDPALRESWLRLIGQFAVVLLAGMLVDRILNRVMNNLHDRFLPKRPQPLWIRAIIGLGLSLTRLIPLMGFVLVCHVTLNAFEITGTTRRAAGMLVGAYMLTRFAVIIAQYVLAPREESLRLWVMENENAAYGVEWVRRLAGLILFGWMGLEGALVLGLPKAGYALSLKVLGLAVVGLLIVLILQNRTIVADWLRRDREGLTRSGRLYMVRKRLADLWHIMAIFYLVAVLLVWLLGVKGGFEFMVRASLLSLMVCAVSLGISVTLHRLIDRGFALSAETQAEFPMLEARANRYLPFLHVLARAIIWVVTFVALAQVWGLGTFSWLVSESGRGTLGTLLTIAFVVVVALLIWEGVAGWIAKFLQSTESDESKARARTLLPLVRSVLAIFLSVMVALIVMSELGVNIGPLLAGAGVIGIAIGFGSQKLVQDVINGIFILFEDTMSVGDIIEIDTHRGTVESMSIRVIRLRDISGNVHTIPFSAVTTIVNMSKDWAFALSDVRVSYRDDPDHVVEILKDIAAELQQDPEFGPRILEPLEVMGVEAFDGSAQVIRVRFKCIRLQQWPVRREFNRRIKLKFAELGLELPHNQTTLWFGNTGDAKAQKLAPPPSNKAEPEQSKPEADKQENPSLPAKA